MRPGTLGQVCLQQRWKYFGVCRTAAHKSFVQNRLDRDILARITNEQSALYEPRLAKLIKVHFSDVLEQLSAVEAALHANESDDDDE